jgi:membrane fusion protein (multidrug efflux system)
VTSQASREAPPPKVTVIVTRKANVPIIGRRNATTRALSEVTIRARVKGFLQEKHFQEGSNVKKGELLLVIDEEPFKAKVAQAKAVLDAAEATLRKAKESKDREVAKAQVALDETQLKLDKIEERRERNLLARKAASQEDYDRAKARAEKSAAQVESTNASLQQSTADYDINIQTAQANLEKARADLDSASIDLSYCRMIAPIDGRIGELQYKLGNLVGPAAGATDTALVTIQQLNPMGVDIRASSRYLPIITKLVRSGLEVKLSVQGDKLHPHAGKVVFLDNTVDPTTSTVLVKAQVPNPAETLLPGEYVQCELNVGEYAGVIVVPDQAIVESQEGSRVFVVDSQNKVQVALVKPMSLDAYQGMLALESGLEEGQKVIVEQVQRVRSGQSVQPEEVDLETFARSSDLSHPPDPLDSPLVRIHDSADKSGPNEPKKKDEGAKPSGEPPKAPAPPEKTSASPKAPQG